MTGSYCTKGDADGRNERWKSPGKVTEQSDMGQLQGSKTRPFLRGNVTWWYVIVRGDVSSKFFRVKSYHVRSHFLVTQRHMIPLSVSSEKNFSCQKFFLELTLSGIISL